MGGGAAEAGPPGLGSALHGQRGLNRRRGHLSTTPRLGPCRAETQGCTIILNSFLNFYKIEIERPCDHPIYSPGDTFLEEWKERRKTGCEGRRQVEGEAPRETAVPWGSGPPSRMVTLCPRCRPHCPGLLSPGLALDLASCAWISSRGPPVTLPSGLISVGRMRPNTPEAKGGGTPGEAPSLWCQPLCPVPCALCSPHRRSQVRRCPTQLSFKSFICARLAPQCPGQGWEAGSKSHSTLSWGSSTHS